MRDTGWGARFLDSDARTVNASTAWRQRARVVLTAGGHMGINMNKFGITALSATALLGSLALMNAAHAQSTWNVYSGSNGGSGCAQNATNSGNYNNSWACTGVGNAGTAMTASAWSTDRGLDKNSSGATTYVWVRPDNTSTSGTNEYDRKVQSTSPGTGYVKQELTYTGSGTAFASAYMSAQGTSGFGAASRTEGRGATSPNHAFDSVAPGTTDMMLLDFGSVSVVLDKVGIGWKGTDSDITVMRWTGDTAPARPTGTTAIGGNQNLQGNLATSTMAGWELVGSFADLGTDNSLPFGGAAISTGATKGSSWWLISTYNTTFDTTGKCKTCTMGDDAFKINFIATLTPKTPPNEVPEPGSLALAGVALAGVLGARRRPKQA